MQYTVFEGKLYGIFLALNLAYYTLSIKQRANIIIPIISNHNQIALFRIKTSISEKQE